MSFTKDLLGAYASGQQSATDKATGEYNAAVDMSEAASARQQGVVQEGIVRNASREAFGRQLAAFGAAGVGYGGSTAGVLRQSAVNQELDALSTRYKANMTGWAYENDARLAKYEGRVRSQQDTLRGVGSILDLVSNPDYTKQLAGLG